MASSAVGEEREAAAAVEGGGGAKIVSFPRRNLSSLEPIKLEGDQDNSSSADSNNSNNMWQVYALGGFVVTRWIWARWKEGRDRGAPPEDSSG